MSKRLNVLISAYACEPGKGSEPEVGWQWALQMARFHDVTVLTRANNRAAIEAGLAPLRGKQPLPRFVYHDRSALFIDMKRRARAIKLYYLLWQKSARDIVQRLHEVHQYDLMHHVTFAGFRYPVAIWGLGTPCIWGPVGGIESIPRALLPWRHPLSLVHEVFRNVNNVLQATPFHVLPKRARATTLILVSTAEMQRTFSRLGFDSEIMPTIGLKTAELPYRSHPPRQGPIKLLFVGNIITLKGVDLALQALHASGTDATLTLVGSGNYLNAAKALAAELGLQARIRFLGRLARSEVLKIYPDHDVLLFPSLHDTGGYAVIEAMFNELPVICLDCGGPAVAVRADCGIKVPLGKRAEVVAGLAAAIRSYAQNPVSIQAHGRNARGVVLRDYDWDNKGAQMNERYARAIALWQATLPKPPRRLNSYSGMGTVANLVHRLFSLRGLVIALLGLVLIGALGFLSVGHLKRQAARIGNDTLPGLTYAGEANASLAQAFHCTLRTLLTDNPAQRAQLVKEIDTYSRITTLCLASYKQQIHEPEDQLLFDTLLRRRRQYFQIRERTLALVQSHRLREGSLLCDRELLPAYTRYKEAGEQLFQYNIRQGQASSKTIMTVCTVTQFVVAGIGILVFLVGFLIGLFK